MPLSGLHDYTYIRKPFVLTVHTIRINVLVHAFLHRFEQRLQYLRLVVNHIYILLLLLLMMIKTLFQEATHLTTSQSSMRASNNKKQLTNS